MPRSCAPLLVAAMLGTGLQPRDAAGSADEPPGQADRDRPRLAVAEIVARCEPSVAVIEGERGGGTGFLVRRRLLVTNYHVIANESIRDIRVRFPSARARDQGPYLVELVSQDRGRDLAFLSIKSELPPLRLAPSYKHVKGEDVIVIGSPVADGKKVLENAVSRGLMSTRATIGGQDYYQLGIAVNPGNSGGPVLNLRGEVVGVVTLKLAQKEGIALCIPVERLATKVAEAERAMRRLASAARRPGARDRAPVAAGREPAVQRQAVPDAKAIEAARKEVREVFDAELKQATTPGQQTELAEKLVEAAGDAEGDAAAQFALLGEARSLAAHAGDLEASLHIIDLVRETFEGVSPMDLEVETLVEVARCQTSDGGRLDVARAALDRVSLAIEKDEFEAARRLIGLAKADKASSSTLAVAVKTTTAIVDSLAARFQKTKLALATLEKSPDDPEANLEVGTYRSLWKGDWARGLPMMAKGGQAPLAEIARRDLAEPGEPSDQVRLGDSWWEQAGRLVDPARTFARQRAAEWYDRCADRVAGMVKVRAKKRLDEHASTADARESDPLGRPFGSWGSTRPGLVAEFFEGIDFTRRLTWRIDPNIDFNWGDKRGDKLPDPDVTMDRFSVRWTGYLHPPKAGTYTLRIKSDNGLRLVIGDRVVYDKLAPHGQYEDDVAVELKARPQPMRIDYVEGGLWAWCHLSWRRPGQSEIEPIPAKCFSHTRDQEPRDRAGR